MAGKPQLTEDDYRNTVKIVANTRTLAIAAREVGISIRGLQHRLSEAWRRYGMAPAGATPAPNPPGTTTGKTTVQLDAEGNVIQEWRRCHPSLADLHTVAFELADTVRGIAKLGPPPRKPLTGDLLAEFVIPDQHHGLYCWSGDTPGDWDVAKSTTMLLAAMAGLVSRTPTFHTALLAIPGDFFHTDNRSGVTESAGHRLDVDTRFDNVIATGVETLCQVVDMLYRKCGQVKVAILPGNHDWHSAKWMAMVLRAYYRRQQSIAIYPTTRPRIYIQWGKVLLGLAHGDRIKPEKWAQIMATEAALLWGRTTYHHWHLGHYHTNKSLRHADIGEHNGCRIEYLANLAVPDAWHMDSGYIGNQRQLEAFVWHNKFGLIMRHAIHADELQPA